MASNMLYTLSLLACLLFYVPCLASEKVPMEVYYDGLQFESSVFVAGLVARINANKLILNVDLHMSPWGNQTAQCQLDENECSLNTIEACVIHVWQDLGNHLTIIHCLEYLVANRTLSQWETCFEAMYVRRTLFDECYRSELGTELELQYANERSTLNPPFEYTPWVVVDGKPLYQDYNKWISYVCGAYKGSPLPEACSKAKQGASN